MTRVPVIDLRVTGICNLGCRYCFGELDSKAGMERAVFVSALAFAKSVGASAIEFCGGEPLLYKEFEWAARLGRDRGFTLILRTNALLLARRRGLVASHFDYVGISLDGDAPSNAEMRPAKGATALSVEDRFGIPLAEIVALKSLNPNIHVILASVATRANLAGLRALAAILMQRRPPIDLWKVYQFVPNYFRAKLNAAEFALPNEWFERLASDLDADIDGAFPLLCSPSSAIDGSCLVVNRDGDVLLGSRSLGNVCSDNPEMIRRRMEELESDVAIAQNKTTTYPALFHQ